MSAERTMSAPNVRACEDEQPPQKLSGWGRLTAAVFIGGLGIVAAGMLVYTLRGVVLLFGTGFIVALVLEPALSALQRRGLSRLAAVRLVFVALLLVLLLVVTAVVPMLIAQVREVAHDWPRYTQRAGQVYEDGRDAFGAWLASRYPAVDPRAVLDERVQAARAWASAQGPGLLRRVSEQIGASLGMLMLGVIVLVISFHCMLLKGQIENALRRLVPRRHAQEVGRLRGEISAMLSSYIRGLVAVSAMQGIATGIAMLLVSLIFGSGYALIIAVLAVFSPFVPYLGILAVVSTAGLLTYMTAQHHAAAAALVAVVLVWGIDQVFDLLVKPNLVGRRINLHPITSLFSVFAGYSLFGFGGLLIGMPLAASVKIILARWVPVIGPAPGVHAPKEPLVLDLGQFAADAWTSIRRLSETIVAAAEQTVDRVDRS